MARRFLGEILIDEGLVSRQDLEKALEVQKAKLGEVLIEMGAISAGDVEKALHVQCSGPTRAEAHAARLRLALWALAAVTVLASLALWALARDAGFQGDLRAGKLPAARVRQLLADHGASPGLRLDALRSLRNLEDPGARVELARRGLGDPFWGVRLAALELARSEGLEALIPDIVPLLLDEEPTVERTAEATLEALTGADPGEGFQAWVRWARGQGLEVRQPERHKEVVP